MQQAWQEPQGSRLRELRGSTQCQTPNSKLSEFQSVVCTSAASTLSGGLMEMHILRLHPNPEVETHGGAQHTV